MAIDDDENTETTRSVDRSGEYEPHPNVEALEKGTAVGRYLILQPLGQGGMGIVYAAYDPELDRKIALKLVRVGGSNDATSTMRLTREAQAMAKVVHPNVVTVHEVGSWYGRMFLAMELVDGSTLTQWLRDERRGWPAVLQMFVAAGQGLAAAHSAGLVHRDFKPDNVLVGKDGRARVTDFGLVRPAGDPSVAVPVSMTSSLSPDSGAVTEAGVVMGTPAYMAPEQMEGGVTTAAADQFAFAVSVYFALYGEKPFSGETMKEIYAQVCAKVLRPPPAGNRVPAYLRRVLARALQPEAAQRFGSMEQLLSALQNDPRRRLRRGLLVSAVAMVVLSGPAFLAQRAWADAHRCDHVERALGGIWDPARRAQLEQRIAGTSDRSASPWVLNWLDGYSALWTKERRRACELERDGKEDARLTASRNACVERRRVRLAATVEMLLAADSNGLADVRRSLKHLGMVKACEGEMPVPRPGAPSPNAIAMQEEVNRAELLAALGRREEAERQARDTARRAQEAGEHRVASEAFAALANALDDRQTNERTVAAWRQALLEAEASHEDEQVFDIRLQLANAQVYSASDYDEALWTLDQAEATLKRLALPKEREAELYRTRANALEQAERPRQALPVAQRAVELSQAAAERAADVADDLQTLANVQSDLGDIVGSAPIYAQLLEAQRAAGELPENMEHSELYLGEELVMMGQYAQGLPHLQQVRLKGPAAWHAIDSAHSRAWRGRAHAALGDYEKADSAIAEANLERSALNRPEELSELLLERGEVELLEQHYDALAATMHEARGLLEAAPSANESRLLEVHLLEAERMRREGKRALALEQLTPMLERAAAIDDAVLGTALRAEADELKLELKQPLDGAAARLREAVAVIEKNEGPASPSLLVPLLGLARAEADASNVAAARAALDRAAEVATHTPGDRYLAAEIALALQKLRR